MALALNNLKRVDMPLNKETKPIITIGSHIFLMVYGLLYSLLIIFHVDIFCIFIEGWIEGNR